MGEYKRVFPYFGEPSGEPKYEEEELISPILIDKVPSNLYIIHKISYVTSYFLIGLTIICLSSKEKIYDTKTSTPEVSSDVNKKERP